MIEYVFWYMMLQQLQLWDVTRYMAAFTAGWLLGIGLSILIANIVIGREGC